MHANTVCAHWPSLLNSSPGLLVEHRLGLPTKASLFLVLSWVLYDGHGVRHHA